MEAPLSIWVNGSSVDAAEHEGVPLLHFLRDQLGLTRTRYGCGSGSCGACTVMVDGRAVTSCDIPVAAVAGCRIETAEALGAGASAHPVLRVLLEHQAAQCGYCVSGIAMRVKALLDETAKPTRARLLAALDGHFCRCGSQVRMLRALEQLIASPETPE